MKNRVEDYFKGMKMAPNPKRRKKLGKTKSSRYWVTERPMIMELDEGLIDDSEFVLLQRIENFYYYDEEGNLHAFYGSNEYLAELSHCSIRTIQMRLSKLQKLGYLISWKRTEKNKYGDPNTIRLMCAKWSKDKVSCGKGKYAD